MFSYDTHWLDICEHESTYMNSALAGQWLVVSFWENWARASSGHQALSSPAGTWEWG